jgi:hypothetical protein
LGTLHWVRSWNRKLHRQALSECIIQRGESYVDRALEKTPCHRLMTLNLAIQSNFVLTAKTNPLKGGASYLNSLWIGRAHVQRLGLKPLHLYCVITT